MNRLDVPKASKSYKRPQSEKKEKPQRSELKITILRHEGGVSEALFSLKPGAKTWLFLVQKSSFSVQSCLSLVQICLLEVQIWHCFGANIACHDAETPNFQCKFAPISGANVHSFLVHICTSFWYKFPPCLCK